MTISDRISSTSRLSGHFLWRVAFHQAIKNENFFNYTGKGLSSKLFLGEEDEAVATRDVVIGDRHFGAGNFSEAAHVLIEVLVSPTLFEALDEQAGLGVILFDVSFIRECPTYLACYLRVPDLFDKLAG